MQAVILALRRQKRSKFEANKFQTSQGYILKEERKRGGKTV